MNNASRATTRTDWWAQSGDDVLSSSFRSFLSLLAVLGILVHISSRMSRMGFLSSEEPMTVLGLLIELGPSRRMEHGSGGSEVGYVVVAMQTWVCELEFGEGHYGCVAGRCALVRKVRLKARCKHSWQKERFVSGQRLRNC